MALGLQKLAGLRSSLLGSHGPLRVGAAFAMARPWALSVAMHAKAAPPVEEEVLGWGLWGFGTLGFRALVNL